MSNEQSWREKAIKAIDILKKISQPPLQYATITGIGEETVDIALTNGSTYVVYYDPQLKEKFELGQTVRVSPETLAVVGIEGKILNNTASIVKDILDDGRVKIEGLGGQEKVIQTAIPDLKPGENILVDNSYSVVTESLGQATKAYQLDKLPQVPWDAIGGLEKAIEELKEAVENPFIHQEIYQQFPGKQLTKGILLHGPPGCGKTMLGKAVAYNLALQKKEKQGGELDGYFLYAAGPEFLQRFVGTGEEKVREMFSNARETASQNGYPVVIFIDEPEAVLRQRGTGISSDASDPITNQFLVEMDGLNPLENIVVMLATNRPELLDSALIRPGRVDKKVYVPRPNQEAATKIFEIYLKNIPLRKEGRLLGKKKGTLASPKLRAKYANHAAAQVFNGSHPILKILYQDGSKDFINYQHTFSGASVVSIVGKATDYAIQRGIKGQDLNLTKDDLSQAVETEYQQNRLLTNQITKDDVKAVAGEKFEQILEIRPNYQED